MKTVEELISEWSEEERERFRNLIEECREREKELIEISRQSRGNLTKLTDSLTPILSNSYVIRKKANKINDAVLGIYFRLYRKKMPAA
jgi:hypothetical protein